MLLLGRTLDDAVGEAYDKVGAILGLPYPGGPEVDRLAALGNDRAFDFPVSLARRDAIDFSFSGLKTAVLYEVRGAPSPRHRPSVPPPALDAGRRADIAASFQRAAVGALVRKLRAALDRHPVKTVLAGGGVTANSRLRAELVALAAERGVALRLPEPRFCLDNAAMIAGAAAARFAAGDTDSLDLPAVPTTNMR
jgi:N6-L-threonylcarbamoyladenine synthase